MAAQPEKILVVGAGLIGCFIGGLLAAANADVRFLLRPNAAARPAVLRCRHLNGRQREAEARYTHDPVSAADADLVLVCVKSAATESAAYSIAPHLRPGTVVLSLQNGVANPDLLQRVLPAARVLAGLVAFNVVSEAAGSYRQTTSGAVHIQRGVAEVGILMRRSGLAVPEEDAMPALQWGKLLLNLNNALVALADIPLRAELGDRRWRLLLVGMIEEALSALDAAGIEPVMPGGRRPQAVLRILRMPDWLYRLLALTVMRVDPRARSSMWEDLARGRITEIDALQGEILRLAARVGRDAPLNARVLQLIRAAEAGSLKRPLRPEMIHA